MSSISDFLLTNLITYGEPLFGLALFIGAIGFPLPTSLLVIATGAFVKQGLLSAIPAAGIGLAGAVLGDTISYMIGKLGGSAINNKITDSPIWQSAQTTFDKGSWLAVFSSRFLLTAIALPVNLLAGARCKYRKFLVFDIAGEAVWILGYGGLGYLFGSQWELISTFLSDFGGMALGIVVLGIGIYIYLNQRKVKPI